MRAGRPGVPGGPDREARSTPGGWSAGGEAGCTRGSGQGGQVCPGGRSAGGEAGCTRGSGQGGQVCPGGPSAGGEAGCTRGSGQGGQVYPGCTRGSGQGGQVYPGGLECGQGGQVGHQVYPLTRQRLEGRKKKGNGEKRGTGNRGKKKKIGREPDPSVTRRGATCSRPARPKKGAGGRDRPRAQGVPVARRAGGAPARAGPRPCFANRPARGRPPGAPAAGRRRRPDGQTAGGRSRGRKTKACVEG